MLLETSTKQQREPEQGSLLNKVLIKPHGNCAKTTDGSVASCRLLYIFTGVSQVGVVYLKHGDGSVPRADQRNAQYVQIFFVCMYTLTPFLAQPLSESSKYFQFDVIDQCSTCIFQHCVLPFMLSCT